MERVYDELGENVGDCLRANEIDSVETFLLLTQSMVMTALGLKLGSWLKIEQMQKSLLDGIEKTPVQIPATSPLTTKRTVEDDMNKDVIIEIINSNADCQTLIQGKLSEGTSLKKSEKCLICRTVCSHFFSSMIMQKKSVTVEMKTKLAQCIVEAFDCLKVDRNGKPTEIDNEFDQMYPNRNALGTLSSISSFCMMLDHSYNEIACPSIQALMKVMTELSAQGNIRKADPSGLPPLEEYASVFVRWLQPENDVDDFVEVMPGEPPYVLCSTMAFAEENYYVVVLGAVFDCGLEFDEAFYVLIKSYKVFNFAVPGKAKKVVDFFDLIYGIQSSSKLSRVNTLFEKFQLAMNKT